MRYLVAAITVLVISGLASAQTRTPERRFEVASVKPNTSDTPAASRFPLGPGDAYLPGTLFSATNQPLIVYIRFAFMRSQGEQLRLPSWVYDERFDIEGRAQGEPSKDDMRLMVRALLTERFKLAWHMEQRDESVFELAMATPGKLGPQLTPHRRDQPCGQDARFDVIPCGSAGLVAGARPGRGSIAGRAEPITRLAALLSNNGLAGVDRTVIDRSGLVGTFDFTVEWAVPLSAAASASQIADDTDPSLGTALREQLGLTLRATRASIDVPIIDHIERPNEN